jgi:hypothetical protein
MRTCAAVAQEYGIEDAGLAVYIYFHVLGRAAVELAHCGGIGNCFFLLRCVVGSFLDDVPV